jgi:hypothetical protein
MTEVVKRRKSSKHVASGPAQGTIPGTPGKAGDVWAPNGIRPEVGLNPYVPQQNEGIRMDPAISVPTPSIEPRRVIRAASPPLEPPAVRFVLCGFSVRPKMLLSESPVFKNQPRTINVCGILVLTYRTAPRSRRTSTSTEFMVSGSRSKKETNPIVD